MGQLLFLSDFHVHEERGSSFNKGRGNLDPSWYFEGAYWNSGSGGGWHWEFDVEKSFPHACPVHQSHFGITYNNSTHGQTDDQRHLKIHMRRFIERNCQGTCIFTTKQMNYHYAYEIDEEHRRLYDHCEHRLAEVHHGFHMFNFDYEADAIAFRLMFKEVSDLYDRHPTFEVDDESIELANSLNHHSYRVYKRSY